MEGTMRVYLVIMISILSLFGNVNSTIDIGINYGMQGSDLPSHADAVDLLKKYNIGKIRLFDPVPEALDALKGSGIAVTLGIKNEDLPNLAASQEATKKWFDTYVQPYVNDIQFSYITAGNEVIPGEFDQYVLPVMQNLQNILTDYNYAGIRTTTVIATSTLGTPFPPSAGAFLDNLTSTISPILRFLSDFSSPLLVNTYPYFIYAADPNNVPLDFALLNTTEAIIKDGDLSYTNLLDAILDSLYSAMERLDAKDVELVVAESGWPSAGNGDFTTPELAGTYNRNFVKKFLANAGTPKRPDTYIEGFIFALFNENLKLTGIQQNFGLFLPDKTPVYPVF